jgi:hypothetical protein
MRPGFRQGLAHSPERFFAALAVALRSPDGACRGQTFGTAAILRLRDGERRVWSPALHLSVVAAEGGALELQGRFSPSSPVWTAFVGIYIALATLGLGALSWGGAQLTMDETPWALLGVPIALALAGFTYGATLIGQGLGADDMHRLRAFVDDVDRQSATPTG